MLTFEMRSPITLEELHSILQEAPDDSKILAGGTDLIIHLREKRVHPSLVIDLSRLNALRYIQEKEDFLHIGAATCFTDLAESPLVRNHAACLAEAAAGVGSAQIRNMGTLGGNLANASPAADSLPALVALGAQVVIEGPSGRREQPVADFLVGVEKTTLQPKEVILEVRVPKFGAGYHSSFVKLGRRKALAIARINLAMVMKIREKNVEDIRIGLGAVGEKAYRPTTAEAQLVGKPFDQTWVETTATLLSQVVEEKIGSRSSMPYKREAIKGLVFDVGERWLSTL